MHALADAEKAVQLAPDFPAAYGPRAGEPDHVYSIRGCYLDDFQVDAAGLDGEGLQIGEGEIDFAELASQLDQIASKASFIPEIWQGHKNLGEGFWTALERLEGRV